MTPQEYLDLAELLRQNAKTIDQWAAGLTGDQKNRFRDVAEQLRNAASSCVDQAINQSLDDAQEAFRQLSAVTEQLKHDDEFLVKTQKAVQGVEILARLALAISTSNIPGIVSAVSAAAKLSG